MEKLRGFFGLKTEDGDCCAGLVRVRAILMVSHSVLGFAIAIALVCYPISSNRRIETDRAIAASIVKITEAVSKVDKRVEGVAVAQRAAMVRLDDHIRVSVKRDGGP